MNKDKQNKRKWGNQKNDQRKKNKPNSEEQGEGESGGRKENRPTWLNLTRTERHPGSYRLEDILESEDYKTRRIVRDDGVKRKFVLCISYLGTNYQGLQINPDANTVEKELERALFLNGSIIEDNFGYMQKVQWTRAARTDRGVHALTQSIALRIILPKEAEKNIGNAKDVYLQQLNSFLPPDIRVQGMIKAAKSFNAYNQCTKRIYHYLLPTYVLEEMATVNGRLAKFFEEQGPVQGAGYEGGYIDPATSKTLTREYLTKYYQQYNKDQHYRLSKERYDHFNSILKLFEGTKSYHNYTTGKDSSEASAKRYILSCQIDGEPFINQVNQVEYIRIIIYGQSFLLNQIRKMLGMAIEYLRGNVGEELFQASFAPDRRMDIPMVPSLGLYLYDLFFDGYNNKQQKMKEHELSKFQEKIAAATAPAPAPAATEEVAAPVVEEAQKEENEGDDGKDGGEENEQVEREPIIWMDHQDIKQRVHDFQLGQLYPHMFAQEEESLTFLFYLDFLRAFPPRHGVRPDKDGAVPIAKPSAATAATNQEA